MEESHELKRGIKIVEEEEESFLISDRPNFHIRTDYQDGKSSRREREGKEKGKTRRKNE